MISGLGIGDRVGLVPFQEDTAPVYRALDVAVHASTNPEPFGLAIVEAMASRRPVVVSAAGGAAEIVRDGENGLTHLPGDVSGLAKALERLCRDEELRHRLGQRARCTVQQQHSIQRVATDLSQVYERVCLNAGPSRS
jgi:glycosyltransferase involved in cell wall biosynthesis